MKDNNEWPDLLSHLMKTYRDYQHLMFALAEQWSTDLCWHAFLNLQVMDKIKNGDSVIYKDQQGTIYGKPRENKFKGTLYTVKVGNDYFKASPSELSLSHSDAGKGMTQ